MCLEHFSLSSLIIRSPVAPPLDRVASKFDAPKDRVSPADTTRVGRPAREYRFLHDPCFHLMNNVVQLLCARCGRPAYQVRAHSLHYFSFSFYDWTCLAAQTLHNESTTAGETLLMFDRPEPSGVNQKTGGCPVSLRKFPSS
jgi:hypothetical protein